jgi:DNA-binding LacI/PurR family transcriptional regulator
MDCYLVVNMGKPITLQTIADELGVSRTTVSNAFVRPDQLSDHLRETILATARRLGYAGPDPAARVLRRGQSDVLGVVLTDSLEFALGDAYYGSLLKGLAVAAEADGMAILLIPKQTQGRDGLREAVVDSICACTLHDDSPAIDVLLERGLPTVFIDGPRIDGIGFVGIDDRAAMADAINHVLDLGHRRVAVLSYEFWPTKLGPIDEERLAATGDRVVRERVQGALAALAARGLEPTHLFDVGRSRRSSVRQVVRTILGGANGPTAAVCLSDQVALGVLDAAADLGLRVPEDLSIVGFDDIPAAEADGLTTIGQPSMEKGTAAFNLVRSGGTEHVLLPHTLVVRDSTGPWHD